jgi:hypothetical protein
MIVICSDNIIIKTLTPLMWNDFVPKQIWLTLIDRPIFQMAYDDLKI